MSKRSRLVSLLALAIASPALAQPTPDPTAPPPPAGEQPTPPPATGSDTQPVPAPPVTTPPPATTEPVTTTPVVAPAPAPAAPVDDSAPLSFKIGNAYITPIGFMDFTGVWRNHAAGSGIGTNFASIPYGVVYQDKLSESRLSMQNSRVGFRVDAPVHGAHVLGYMEADFLGNNPGNVAVSSNSNTLRSRLYWVDVRKDEWELLAGQTWSLITPGRAGISPLPSDVFYTQDVDVNYQAGLVWGRIPELRVAYHPTKMVTAALAIDQAEPYIGGSAGGALITLPMSLATLAGTQLNNGATTVGTPNLLPDLIAKVAIDPAKEFHIELGGVGREFKIWNPANGNDYSATGAGGFLNIEAEVLPGLRLVTNNFWGTGVGRYIFGQAPDLIVQADGSLKTLQAGSTVSGIEFTHDHTMLYGYFGGVYIGHEEGPTTAGGTCMDAMSCVGYGYAGSPASQNKTIAEYTLGFNQTFWKDPKYGALNLMGQYSRVSRTAWSFADGASDAKIHMVFLNLRYSLPGAAPKLK